jgi:hypothetical protein
MTTITVPPPVSVETVLRDAWKLLRRNWVLVAPLLLALVAMFVVTVVLAVVAGATGAFTDTKAGGAAVGAIVVALIVMVVGILAISVSAIDATFGMADAVWTKGTTSLADGAAAARDRFGATVVAFVGFIGLFIVVLVLLIPTLGIAMLAFPVVTMYVLPAVVSGRIGGFEAFRESWRLVRRYFGSSAIACLILIALQYLISLVLYVLILPLEVVMAVAGNGHSTASLVAMGIVAVLLAIVSLLMIVVLYAYQAYHALAIVGLYRWLRARADTEDAAAVAAAAAGPAPPG